MTLTESKVGSKVVSWAVSYGNMSWERLESFKELVQFDLGNIWQLLTSSTAPILGDAVVAGRYSYKYTAIALLGKRTKYG